MRCSLHVKTCAALASLAFATAGCFNPFSPIVSNQRAASVPAPVPNSPVNAIKLFQWCYDNRAVAQYREVFTDDYRFQFSQSDSAGNQYRSAPWTRTDELSYATNIFVGSPPDRLPAKQITLALANSLVPLPDSRPGTNPRWHQQIRTTVTLNVTEDTGNGNGIQDNVNGYALFYLVRGDSAVIPDELKARGFVPDSTRWWIQRWDDETITTGATAALPAGPGALAAGRAGAASARRATGADPIPIVARYDLTMGELKVKFR